MLERLNKEVKRRTKVVGVFPDRPTVIRLAGSVLIEIDDDWRAAPRQYFSQKSMQLVTNPELSNEDHATLFLEELTLTQPVEAPANLHH